MCNGASCIWQSITNAGIIMVGFYNGDLAILYDFHKSCGGGVFTARRTFREMGFI